MAWNAVTNLESIDSPGLLVDPDRVAENVQRMVDIVGGTENVARLRPHVKTHKMPDAIGVQLRWGINQFKTATLAEAEMVASAGGSDVLVAHQMVGPKLDRLIELIGRYPSARFSTIVDDPEITRGISDRLSGTDHSMLLFIDVDCGMGRTGVAMGPRLDLLREEIESLERVSFGGLHVYDGHLHQPSLDARREAAMNIINSVRSYSERHRVPEVVGGGSPTFAIWARETAWQCSPGTSILWDIGYGGAYPELPFSVAAALVTRVISKPGNDDRLCLDLGYKAVSAEMPLRERVVFPNLPDAMPIAQSEEHLVVSTSKAGEFKVGDPVIALPRHICPTVALHRFATLVRDGKATSEQWPVTARDR